MATREHEGATMAKRAGIVAFFTLASRILGYVRDAVMASAFGAGPALDAYIAAQTIPNALRRLVAEGSLMIAFIPVLTAERDKGGLPAMQALTRAVLGVLLPTLLLLTGLGMWFPEVAVTAFAGGFDQERFALAVHLTRLMMPFLFFVSLTALASGALNTQGVFAAPAAAPILLNIAIIGASLGATTFFEVPITAVAWGTTLGGVLQLLLQLPWLRREGLLVAPRWLPNHPGVRALLRLMGPSVFGAAVYQLNLMVVRNLSSSLSSGQMSCYFWATRLEEFALGVFAVSVSIAALPTLSKHAASKNEAAYFATLKRALQATNFITVPATAVLFLLADPIVAVLFHRGRFTVEDGQLTAQLLQIMVVGLAPIGIVRVLVPAYYALSDTRPPVVAGVVSLSITGAVGYALKDRFQIHGLTWATILAATAQVLVLAALLKARARARLAGGPNEAAETPQKSTLAHALRCVLAVVPGAALAALGASRLDWYQVPASWGAAALGGLLGLAGVSYLGLAKLLGVEEVNLLLGTVRRKLRR